MGPETAAGMVSRRARTTSLKFGHYSSVRLEVRARKTHEQTAALFGPPKCKGLLSVVWHAKEISYLPRVVHDISFGVRDENKD